MKKRYLNQLSIDELKQVFDSNNDIKIQVMDRMSEDNNYFVKNEIVSYFQNYNSITGKRSFSASFDYDSYDRVHIKVKDEDIDSFIEDFQRWDLYEKPENITAIADRLSEKASFFRDIIEGYEDVSNTTWNNFSFWIYEGINKLTQFLANTIQDIYDSVYDDDNLFSMFSDEYYLEDSEMYILNDDFSKVYEDISYTKCYQ